MVVVVLVMFRMRAIVMPLALVLVSKATFEDKSVMIAFIIITLIRQAFDELAGVMNSFTKLQDSNYFCITFTFAHRSTLQFTLCPLTLKWLSLWVTISQNSKWNQLTCGRQECYLQGFCLVLKRKRGCLFDRLWAQIAFCNPIWAMGDRGPCHLRMRSTSIIFPKAAANGSCEKSAVKKDCPMNCRSKD